MMAPESQAGTMTRIAPPSFRPPSRPKGAAHGAFDTLRALRLAA